ncbi:MAG: dihydrolipoyl dehydrogenase [Candidatus Accumulibacter phosphatis]|jgi:dihydrolipoamide dehydrogenase|uniref:Dihydrolipoyl dehydrogenase n=2 Tax=Candidatus Accumulibacter TaxID=327159 RepID=A0A080LZK6_9PROT|nr:MULTISPECIES: dihydrolipoyl dehydrogenase [Candidatus Accumulibacter]KFB74348.1 MAG: Dihydrolipoyl dehydrogenase [Candidatus Accumulibacter phosphatis]MBL8408249.1 dihydrolipoyl dehydrogenase [Accumulibacter sp.]NMQ04950.1 dihydrolipoyl dehydrogenase [Candidatus Accumulibacter contiguus]HRF10981.1 dihydrolipoyl dehydrogenase [Candidatus Accumulibacter phosphatis]
MSKQFDVLVIGGGPGGYIAAIRAAQLGFHVACCESNAYADPKGEPRLGGTCLNVGCIPSKALLHTSHLFEEAGHSFADQGICVGAPIIDVARMLARKDGIVKQLTSGIKGLFKKNKVTLLNGHGAFVGRKGSEESEVWQLKVGDTLVEARQVIVATGSKARHLPGVPVDNEIVCDNVGALDIGAVPKKLAVIGAGVIGLEMGSVWRRLGAEVTILEALPDFLSVTDLEVAKEAARVFAKQGLKIVTGIEIGDVKISQKGVSIDYTDKDGSEQKIDADRLIVSIGRIPNTDGLGAEQVGLKLTERGQIEVDAHCRTNLPGVWAVGDVVAGPMLAHKAMEEGVMVAEIMAGQAGHCNHETVPWVIYTSPEIAWVGKTEQQLKAEGVAYKAGKIPFAANGRALGMGDPGGFVKMLACATTDRILGVHIIGANASELISEGVVAMEFGAAAEDLARICHAHPTLSEVVHEAALACDKRPLHF